MNRIRRKLAAATSPAAGMVTSHARSMSWATAQRTDFGRKAAPAPNIEEEITWVVETGNPRAAVRYITAADVLCAAKPWTGRTRKNPPPRVRMILHPPTATPKAMAREQARTTQCGTNAYGPAGGR